jgi:hypothetical protein
MQHEVVRLFPHHMEISAKIRPKRPELYSELHMLQLQLKETICIVENRNLKRQASQRRPPPRNPRLPLNDDDQILTKN